MDFASSFTTDLCNVESQLFSHFSKIAAKYLELYGNTTLKYLDRFENSVNINKNRKPKLN